MKRTVARLLTTVVLLAFPLVGVAETTDLDVTRVALFSSGVAHFECESAVTGDTTAELKFRTDQINDIIKSMVVQDFGGGRIGVVSYASQDPIEKTLRSFGVDLTGKPTLGELLDQLRGEPVEIMGERQITGTILGVERQRVVLPNDSVVEHDVLNVLTGDGLEQIRLGTGRLNIKLGDEKVDAELRKALSTLATAHNADKKSVTLSFEGEGERTVRVAYLLEAPIWKTSYRLVLAEDKDPFVQGWATVENATEEDWNDVRLSLISGRPISFRMDLYTPLYIPRPIEQLELYASLRPPEYAGGFAMDATADKKPARLSRRARGRAEFGEGVRAVPQSKALSAPALAGEPVMAGGRGFLRLAETGVASVAAAQEAGELFEYRIDTPVSIPRQHSAMLPIVTGSIEAEKVSIFNPAVHGKHPLNGLELKNTTKLHLMQGPVTVFDENVYAGDAKLPDLRPDEKRLIAYALDLSTEVMIKQKPTPDELVSLRIVKGTLWHRHKYVDRREYLLKNKRDRDRVVLLEQPYSEEWKLMEPKEVYEQTPELLRLKVLTPAGETVAQTVRLERIADQSIILTNVGLDDIRHYLRASVITPAVKAALEKVVELRLALEETSRRRARLERQREEDVAEQARIRENLKTLDRNSDAYKRQLEEFDEVDERIGKQRELIHAARDEEEQRRGALEDYLRSLNVE